VEIDDIEARGQETVKAQFWYDPSCLKYDSTLAFVTCPDLHLHALAGYQCRI
jgi:hypothetical protein